MAENACYEILPGSMIKPPMDLSAFSAKSIGELETMRNDVEGQGSTERPQTSEPMTA
jgi:hypothetical protein